MTIRDKGYNKATGGPSETLTVTLGSQASNLFTHSIAIDPGDSTSGTITVTATAQGNSSAETVFDTDGTTALVINLATSGEPFTRTISGIALTNIICTPSTLNGSADWTVTVSSKQ